jgi:hypothetical protein
MLKMFVLLLPLLFGAATPDLSIYTVSECPMPSWLQKTTAADGNYSMEWGTVSGATEYEVWYIKNGYTSPVQTTNQTSFTFNNLVSGNYTFYVRTVCTEGVSSFIGNNDILEF